MRLQREQTSHAFARPAGRTLTRSAATSVYVHTTSSVSRSTDNWEAMTSEGVPTRTSGPAAVDMPLIVPLKSILAGDLHVQLYAQTPAARA